MKQFYQWVISVVAVGALILMTLFVLKYNGPKETPKDVRDSVDAKAAATKSPILAGKVAATIEHCKLYELESDKNAYIYWSICYDAKGQISTSVTVVPKTIK